jgi:hypothetical protein
MDHPSLMDRPSSKILSSAVNLLSMMDHLPRLHVYRVLSLKEYVMSMRTLVAVCVPLSPHRLNVPADLICDSLALLVPLVVFKGLNIQFLFRTRGNELSVLLFGPWVIYSAAMVMRTMIGIESSN